MASRAELKKLEFEAEAEKRMKAIEETQAKAQVRLEEMTKYLESTLGSLKEDTSRINENLTQLTANFNTHVNQANIAVAELQRAVNDLYLAGNAPVFLKPVPTP